MRYLRYLDGIGSIVRSVARHTGPEGCAWCGTRKLNNTLYHYGIDPTHSVRIVWDDKLFCCLSCRMSFYGQ